VSGTEMNGAEGSELMPEVLNEVRGRLLVITLNRPTAVNAIDSALMVALWAAIDMLDNSAELAAGVLTGSARAFCSGMDLKAFAKAGLPKGLHEFYSQGSKKPLIAAVEGVALAGGFELALTCDVLVASTTARFALPEARVGLFAAGGGLIRLPRRIPYGRAMELALTGDQMDGEEAYRLGLVNRLTEPGGALDAAIAIGERIAAAAPLSVQASRDLMRQAHTSTEEEFWELQRPLVRSVFRSSDAREGPRAFAEKRRPTWTGT
jgi:enoyl-CoA hydratase/carnithine racemase